MMNEPFASFSQNRNREVRRAGMLALVGVFAWFASQPAIARGTPPSLAPNKTKPALAEKAPPAPRLAMPSRAAPQKTSAETRDDGIAQSETTTQPRPLSLGATTINPLQQLSARSSIFYNSDLSPRTTPPAPPEPTSRFVNATLKTNEAFVDALARAGVSREDRNNAARVLSKHQNMRTLRVGANFQLLLSREETEDKQNDTGKLISLSFRPNPDRLIKLQRTEGGYSALAHDFAPVTRLAHLEAPVTGSLFETATTAGAPHRAVANFANIFAYDVDFQRDVRKGDTFEALFEVQYGEDGTITGSGDILFGRFNWRGGKYEKSYYLHKADSSSARPDYYDENGRSAKRLLMKTPIDGARLSSGFGTRRHPILGYRKAHKGVDFAARRGTPIYAAGDGVIERMNKYGGYGNYVRIRHSNGYKTAYAHLNGFKRGLRAGRRVKQGDVIGYVGSTGRSTGPHLHYEVLKNGVQVNPQKLRIKTGVTLAATDLNSFRAHRDGIDAARNNATGNEWAPQQITLASPPLLQGSGPSFIQNIIIAANETDNDASVTTNSRAR